ncbi:MAG: divergent PAP2 family protein [Spirochaetales bacterium]|nr:divergent PAP2 family protein [Spirochaetales bacterium]
MNLFNNIPLTASFAALVIAQVLKVILVLIFDRKVEMFRLSSTGGMPSSHSAAVAALSAAIGYIHGMDSPYFAIAAVFSIVVIYDSIGIRRAAGKHAEILNSLVEEFSHLWDEGDKPKALKTLLGHTYSQTFVGTLLGVFVGLFACRWDLFVN